MIQLHPYNLGSKGAIALRDWLEANGCHTIISSRMKKKGRMLVGWGAKEFTFDPTGSKVLNHPEDMKSLTCKRKFFEKIGHEKYIPEWTTDPKVAKEWDAEIVVRHTTTGSGGDGIDILPAGSDVPKAPLYTKYQKKTHEYRVHAFWDDKEDKYVFLHAQQKVFVKGRDGKEEPDDWKIRNHTHGFIFQSVDPAGLPKVVHTACDNVLDRFVDSVDFVALDVIYHKPTETAMVLEGNTAPGLEGERLPLYGNYLKKVHAEYKGR